MSMQQSCWNAPRYSWFMGSLLAGVGLAGYLFVWSLSYAAVLAMARGLLLIALSLRGTGMPFQCCLSRRTPSSHAEAAAWHTRRLLLPLVERL